MTEINFTYLPGDGIGPEVGAASLEVLKAVAAKFGHSLNAEHHLVGGAAIDAGLKPLPDESYESCKRTGAILLGACLLYTSPSPRDATLSRMPSSA